MGRGKPKSISTPEYLWELFEGYLNKNRGKNSAWKLNQLNGKTGRVVGVPAKPPLTMVGFENYLYLLGVKSGLRNYVYNTDGLYDDYQTVVTRIKGFIRQDQIEGGMVGAYNANLTARLNNLSDSVDNQSSTPQNQQTITKIVIKKG